MRYHLPALTTRVVVAALACVATIGCYLGGWDPSNGVCTSGKTGTTGESSRMRPGEACISCHSSGEGEAPIYPFMGTLYPTVNEADNCIGATTSTFAGVQIIVTDANGNTTTMTPNSAGNFYGGNSNVAMPFTAKVIFDGRESDMITPQTNGDCNSCHTVTGANGAPGRVVVP